MKLTETRHAHGSDKIDDLRALEEHLLLFGHTVIFKGRTADWEEVHGKISSEYCLIWEE